MGETHTDAYRLDFDRKVKVEFHGTKVTSDAGLLAYRELDEVLGLTTTIDSELRDIRTGKNTQHGIAALLRQSIYSRLAGYEDTNDAERLALDPAMRHIADGRAVERHITASDVIGTLAYLFAVRGAPTYLRSDNGPEFVAQAIQQWLASTGAETLYIAPGSPWENAYIESFNSRFRDELLNAESFSCVKEAQVLVEDYRRRYNHHRPHSSLGYVPPAAFAATCIPSAPATPPLQEYTSSDVDNSLLTAGT